MTLPGELFDANANVSLMHQVVVAQLAAARQGTHATKTRGQVRGGGAKPYRQKGTGRARQGSTRAPQFAGGGTVFGPQPRDYTQKTPKKMKAAALRGALSDRAREGRVHVVSAFVDGDAPKTKTALATLGAITQAKRVLVVLDRDDVLNWVSLRNAAAGAPDRGRPAQHLRRPGRPTRWSSPRPRSPSTSPGRVGVVASAKPDLETPRHPGRHPLDRPRGGGAPPTATEAPAKKAAGEEGRGQEGAGEEGRSAETRRPRRPLPRRPPAKAAAKKAPAKKAAATEVEPLTTTTEEKA